MRYTLPMLIAAFAVAGCAEKEPMTVSDFLENETALYGTLSRCQDNPSAGTDAECRNARAAAERISVIEERAIRKVRDEAFANAREEYRARLDRERDLRLEAEAEAEEARLQALLFPSGDEDVEVEAEAEAETDAADGEQPFPERAD